MAHYRDTYRTARFLFLDVRVGVIIFASFLHIRPWTMFIDVVVIVLALYVERIGLGFIGALRAVRAWATGPYRPALRNQKIRRKVDYERHLMAWEKELDTSPVALEEVKADDKSLLTVK